MSTPIAKTLRLDAKRRIMREKWLFENETALQKVKSGLEQSAAGKTHDLGSFAKFLDK